MDDTAGSLISSKSSDSGLHIHLHPLVLLNFSDQITRHAVRQQTGPIVGALLGRQQGRNIGLEHVFECKLASTDAGVILDQSWFDVRLKQFKDVHKDGGLDLVGWVTVTPPSGPTLTQLPIHLQILENYNETAIFLAFHAAGLGNMSSAVGKLPITIFETVYEGETAEDGDKSMQIDGQQPKMGLKFRQLPYSIETGEAEMIGVDFVATGGGNASAIPMQTDTQMTTEQVPEKGKKTEQGAEGEVSTDTFPLSREDEDLVANLSTRLSATKILHSRLKLIQAYLVEAARQAELTNIRTTTSSSHTQPSHALLRSIHSLVSHLSLINPGTTIEFSTESLAQANDVALVALLGAVGENVQLLRELGRKFAITYSTRRNQARQDADSLMHARMSEEAFHGRRGMA